MADDKRHRMEQKAREDAAKIDQPAHGLAGVAVPGEESQKGRLVDDAKQAFSRMPEGPPVGQESRGREKGGGHPGPSRMGIGGAMKGRMAGMGRMVAGTATGEQVNVNGAVAVARAEEANIVGASGAVITAGDTTFTGGTMAVVSGGETQIRAGGAPIIVSGDDIAIEKGGGALLIARKIDVEDRGFAGVALGRVKVKDGGTVIISTLPAIVLGLAFGAAFALIRSALTPQRPPTVGERLRSAVGMREPTFGERVSSALGMREPTIGERVVGAVGAGALSSKELRSMVRDAAKEARRQAKAARERVAELSLPDGRG